MRGSVVLKQSHGTHPVSPSSSQPFKGHSFHTPSTPPAMASSSTPPQYRHADFSNFLEHRNGGLTGYNAESETPISFIDQESVRNYWEERAWDDRELQDHVDVPTEETMVNFWVTFSILVSMGVPNRIHEFIQHDITDDKLPLRDDFTLDSSRSAKSMLDEFREAQWRFCPLRFDTRKYMYSKKIHSKQILPIKDREVLRESPHTNLKTKIIKVTFHPGYSNLSKNVCSPSCHLPQHSSVSR